MGGQSQRFSLLPMTPPRPVPPPPSYGKGIRWRSNGWVIGEYVYEAAATLVLVDGVGVSSWSNGSGQFMLCSYSSFSLVFRCRRNEVVDDVQFAYGKNELRPVMRFPKNKGEVEEPSILSSLFSLLLPYFIVLRSKGRLPPLTLFYT
ncbi:hypothetical protein AMTR_s00108p00122350 [Amborella trichopoda]|uniref:Uncharacterized protein n=1 Tax=Amborella trichopoda TaxID=13333 RepID=W1NXE2_AMBTC|nr:hypothetical protein AMTR_s00108p00122350 [Amborella trichopoda]